MADYDDIEFVDDLDDPPAGKPGNATRRSATGNGKPDRERRRFGPRAKRPGENDPLQSPLVMILGAGTLVLLLVAATLWFVIGRHFRHEAFDAARAEMDAKRYRQAIAAFEAFVDEHPHGELAREARLELARAAVLREISGATPRWAEGLTALEAFVSEYRDRDEFDELQPEVFEHAKTIAIGSAAEARRSTNRELLEVFERARRLAVRYVPEGEAENLRKSLDRSFELADAAIHRRETYDAAIAAIRGELDEDRPIAALVERRELLDRFPGYESDETLVELTSTALETERARARSEQVDVAAEREAPPGSPAIALVAHTRATTDRPVGERCVVAVAGGTCFGVDSATGTPKWRYDLGRESRFFPVDVEVGGPGLLLFDDRRLELVHLERDTGRVVWRTPVGSTATDEPLVTDGTVLLSIDDGVHRFDLGTGRRTAHAAFSQPVSGQPAPIDGGRVVVAGERSVFYLLDAGTLACQAVAHFGHRPGAIARLLTMGPYLLVFENDRRDGSRLGMYTVADGPNPLQLVAESRLAGQVFDAPVVRGNRLLVPYGRERVAAFAVSAEEGQQPLVRVADMAANGERGPTYLLPAPADEFWMADTALRRYRIVGDVVQPVPGDAAAGEYTQPLQTIGADLFVARRPPYSEAIFFSQLDGRTFVGEWRVVLADRLAATLPGANDTLVCATASGSLFRVPRERLGETGFVGEPVFTVPVADAADEPLQIASAPPEAIAVAGANRENEPRLWVLNRAGVLDWEVEIPAVPECPPAPMIGGFVIAAPGRLALATRNRALVGEYEAESDAPWLHAAAVVEDTVVVQNVDGQLVRVQYRSSPRAHLAAAGTFTLDAPTNLPFTIDGDRLAVADAATLTVLDTGSMGRLAEFPLDDPPAKSPWLVGEHVLVETRRGELLAYSLSGPKNLAWSVELAGSSLAGRPVTTPEGLLVPLRNGSVWTVDPAGGDVVERRDLGAAFEGNPVTVGDFVLLPTRDGGLRTLASEEEAAP